MTLINYLSHNVNDVRFHELNLQDLLKLRDHLFNLNYPSNIRPVMKTMFVHYKLKKAPIETIQGPYLKFFDQFTTSELSEIMVGK